MALVTPSDYKLIYDIDNVSLDPKLITVIPYAQSVADAYCGYSLEETSYTGELHDGGSDTIILDNFPVTSVASVLVDGLTFTNWLLYTRSQLVFGNKLSTVDTRHTFPTGLQNIVVDYTAGYTSITAPSALKLAIIKITRVILNDKQKSSSGLIRQSLHGEDRQFSRVADEYVDNTIRSLLDTYKKW